jgi:hypothetical protein
MKINKLTFLWLPIMEMWEKISATKLRPKEKERNERKRTMLAIVPYVCVCVYIMPRGNLIVDIVVAFTKQHA